LQYLSIVDDPTPAQSHHSLPVRSQHLQGLSIRTTAAGAIKKELETEIGQMFSVPTEDRELRGESEPHDAHLHIFQ
jgi:hypothetical protein